MKSILDSTKIAILILTVGWQISLSDTGFCQTKKTVNKLSMVFDKDIFEHNIKPMHFLVWALKKHKTVGEFRVRFYVEGPMSTHVTKAIYNRKSGILYLEMNEGANQKIVKYHGVTPKVLLDCLEKRKNISQSSADNFEILDNMNVRTEIVRNNIQTMPRP